LEVDERAGTIIGADKNEMANWWPSARAYVNNLAPSVIDLNIPSDGKTVVTLLFDTNRAASSKPINVFRPSTTQTLGHYSTAMINDWPMQ
jgi:hypothetical protein